MAVNKIGATFSNEALRMINTFGIKFETTDFKLGEDFQFDATSPELGLSREMWISEVARILVQDGKFFIGCKDDSNLIDKNGKIHLPQMNSPVSFSEWVPNVSSDITTEAMGSDILTYSGKLLHSNFRRPDPVAQVQASFSYDSEDAIRVGKVAIVEIQKRVLQNWAFSQSDASQSLDVTTGSPRTNKYGNAAAKALTDVDFLNALKHFDATNVPEEGRRVIVGPGIYNDILSLTKFNNLITAGLTEEMQKRGVIGMYRGFEIYKSNYLPSFASDYSLNPYGTTPGATDKEFALFYHPDFVRFATTPIEIGIQPAWEGLVPFKAVYKLWVGATQAYKAVANNINGVYCLVEG